ncbi:pyrimidine-nucleoside phosphorylase [Spiroplasma chinense]|uniref:Pyrimidine-nucleoside phosphorylase n=1 Tax=Spiroplasma chinense TaxID=216932 RepID=A0A5B9Y4I4_9MOLU|nr:thymidine phosphorylase [Spiroplasma chinense]QEH62078.1 pyrimidine-nucleoside phosphorylase [Spiroplasma chinense]
MNFSTIITKKKNKIELSEQEIKWLVESFVKDTLKDYQMAAFNMAVWFNGMTETELSVFTSTMIESGITYNLDGVEGPFADKHSTGGVGDKTSLIFAPLVASFGVKVSKLSGRGLGQTGGTIDKLESCTGWTGEISEERFKEILNTVGLSIMSQSSNVVPADKKLYALRDVTGTVDSIPLIASSIMSKKLVVPADSIVLDVKVGSGAFMKDMDSASLLSKTMISIGKAHNRNVSVMLTNMDKPLGKAIGNAIEVKEAWDTLHGKGPEDLVELCTVAAALTLTQTGKFSDLEVAKQEVLQVLQSGKAAHYLKDFVQAQGGDFSKIEDYDKHFSTKHVIEIKAEKDGYVSFASADGLGYLSMHLGAGRETKEDIIDFAAGIYLNKTTNDPVKAGEVVMTLYTNIDKEESFIKDAQEQIVILDSKTDEQVILKLITD